MRSSACRSSAAQLSSSICTRLPGILLFLLRHPLAFFARFRKSNRDRLLAALYFSGSSARAASRRSALEAAHFSFDVLPHTWSVLSFALLRHRILLTKLVLENSRWTSAIRASAAGAPQFRSNNRQGFAEFLNRFLADQITRCAWSKSWKPALLPK